MRNMSFRLTVEQFKNRTKDVTRRLGWWSLKPGTVVMGVVKGQGLKKGEKVEKLHAIEIVSVRPQPICAITPEDVAREGFPDKSCAWFIEMYCKANNCQPSDECNRIEFKHL